MNEKLIVFSADALVREDIAYLEQKPNFARLMTHSAQVERVKSIYPSLTYPCHATMFTGCYPDKHGVITNKEFLTWDDGVPHYLTAAADIRAENLFAAAKRAGKTTASIYWPMTGNDPNIDYNINEYFFPYGEDVEETFRRFGASDDTIAAVRENAHRLPKRDMGPGERLEKDNAYEDFMNGCVCSLIRRHRPDVLLVHNCVVDTTRHNFGVFGPEVDRALDLLDEWLGEIIDALEDAGVYDQTNFVLTSDHGQMNYTRVARPNVLLKKGGFIDVDGAGQVTGWRAFAQCTGINAIVRLCDPDDRALYEEVGAFLRSAYRDHNRCGIEQVYTRAEVEERYHLSGEFAYMLENVAGVGFSPAWTGAEVSPLPRPMGASHGYLPEKGPWPVFIAAGPAFRSGARLSMANLVDEAPTLARVLGDSLPNADGRVMVELLK